MKIVAFIIGILISGSAFADIGGTWLGTDGKDTVYTPAEPCSPIQIHAVQNDIHLQVSVDPYTCGGLSLGEGLEFNFIISGADLLTENGMQVGQVSSDTFSFIEDGSTGGGGKVHVNFGTEKNGSANYSFVLVPAAGAPAQNANIVCTLSKQ